LDSLLINPLQQVQQQEASKQILQQILNLVVVQQVAILLVVLLIRAIQEQVILAITREVGIQARPIQEIQIILAVVQVDIVLNQNQL